MLFRSVHEFGVQKILFLDDNAVVHPKRMQQIAVQLQQQSIKVALGCLGTIERYDWDTMQAMHAGGFRWIHYGAESGDDAQLQAMGKRITAQQILETVRATRGIGYRVRTSWIMDLPDLTLDGLKRTEELILEQGSDEIRLHFLTLRMGSILWDKTPLQDSPQYIHRSHPSMHVSAVSVDAVEAAVARLLRELAARGYTVVRDPEQFADIAGLTRANPALKIVSLCPLRYGLGWRVPS